MAFRSRSGAFVVVVALSAGLGVFLAGSTALHAAPLPGQAACWPSNDGEDPRPEISCQSLTPAFLTQLQKATPAEVTRLFGVPGKDGKPTYFEAVGTKPGFYNGYVDITYAGGRVSALSAVTTEYQDNGMAGEERDFRWDARKGGCSDFPGSTHRCNASATHL